MHFSQNPIPPYYLDNQSPRHNNYFPQPPSSVGFMNQPYIGPNMYQNTHPGNAIPQYRQQIYENPPLQNSISLPRIRSMPELDEPVQHTFHNHIHHGSEYPNENLARIGSAILSPLESYYPDQPKAPHYNSNSEHNHNIQINPHGNLVESHLNSHDKHNQLLEKQNKLIEQLIIALNKQVENEELQEELHSAHFDKQLKQLENIQDSQKKNLFLKAKILSKLLLKFISSENNIPTITDIDDYIVEADEKAEGNENSIFESRNTSPHSHNHSHQHHKKRLTARQEETEIHPRPKIQSLTKLPRFGSHEHISSPRGSLMKLGSKEHLEDPVFDSVHSLHQQEHHKGKHHKSDGLAEKEPVKTKAIRKLIARRKLKCLGWTMCYYHILYNLLKENALGRRSQFYKNVNGMMAWAYHDFKYFAVDKIHAEMTKMMTDKAGFIFVKEKKISEAKVSSMLEKLTGYLSVILSKMIALTKEYRSTVMVFLSAVTQNNSYLPYDYITEFEIRRLEFNHFGGLKGMDPEKSKMLINGIVIIRMFIQGMIMQCKELFKVNPDYEKLLNIGSFLYNIAMDIIQQTSLVHLKNQDFLSPDLKLKPRQRLLKAFAGADVIEDLEKFKILKDVNRESEIVDGFYSKQQMDCIFYQKRACVEKIKHQMQEWMDAIYEQIKVFNSENQILKDKS